MTNDNTPQQMPNNIPPFVQFCCANVPAVFDDSLSYYEALCALWKYLQDCINVINNNAMLEEEYIEKFNLLEEYVEHYFDNLDVQQEINNKLDAMLASGELGALLSALIADTTATLESQLTNFESVTTARLDSIDSRVDAAVSGAPIPVSSTDDMTDTTKVYVNTTDGKWYYYDGDSWEIGGTYQSSGIADGAITVFNLDNTLQNDFIRQYEDVAIDCNLQGYATGTDSVTINTSSDYVHDVIDLENNTFYEFSGLNYYSVVGLIVADSSDNIIYSTRSQSSSAAGATGVYLRFKTNQAGLKAYINTSSANPSSIWTPYIKQAGLSLSKLSDVVPNYQDNTLEAMKTITGLYGTRSSTIGAFPVCNSGDEYYTIEFYKINKGIKYHVLSGNYGDISGIIITDTKMAVTYQSSSSYVGTLTEVDYTFTASEDGYLVLSYRRVLQPYHAISIVDALSSIQSSPLKYKKIVYDGDSICESRLTGNAANGGAYPKIIADIVDGTYANQAVGGGTLSYVDSQASHSVVHNLSNLPVDGDIYCFEGGINDWWSSRQLGTFDETDYTSTPDESTITGAMEKIFRYALSNFVGKPIVFVIIHKVSSPYSTFAGVTFAQIRERMIAVCTKYSIPYFDAWKESGLNGTITAQKNAYLDANQDQTPDGTHPNEAGYKKFYVPQLLSLLESVIEK